MIEQGAVSACACAVDRCVRAVRAPRGGSRRTRTASGRATATRRPAGKQACTSIAAALEEAPAPLTLGPIGLAPTSVAQSLQHASEASTHVPIVGHMHMHTKHDAMRKPLCSMEMLLDKKVLSSQHPVRRGNASTRRADVPRQLDAHEKLCHVAV